MIKRIDTKSGKTISYVYNLKDEDYRIVSERLETDAEKIKNDIDEETFTPRISKSGWEIYKLYYPTVKKSTKDKEQLILDSLISKCLPKHSFNSNDLTLE